MDRKTFITNYYLSAVAGNANSRSNVKPWEIIEDAEEAWAALDQIDADATMGDLESVRQKRTRGPKVVSKGVAD